MALLATLASVPSFAGTTARLEEVVAENSMEVQAQRAIPKDEDKKLGDIVRAVVARSKKGHYAFLVDKINRTASLYHDGTWVDDYAVALGENPIGDKVCRDDMRTPEGLYHIRAKKDGNSDFGYSFILDYPTSEDRREFRIAKMNHAVPDTIYDPGSSIAIHAWSNLHATTNGCIGLVEEDMLELMEVLDCQGNGTVGIVAYVPDDCTCIVYPWECADSTAQTKDTK